jgi:hypothetical protein
MYDFFLQAFDFKKYTDQGPLQMHDFFLQAFDFKMDYLIMTHSFSICVTRDIFDIPTKTSLYSLSFSHLATLPSVPSIRQPQSPSLSTVQVFEGMPVYRAFACACARLLRARNAYANDT